MQPDQQLSLHFWLSEFTSSQAAARLGLRNEPLSAQVANLKRLALKLEEARRALGDVPLIITSGFRSPLINKTVGGASSSAHMDGRAADFIVPTFGDPKRICQRLVDSGLSFDQLICEGTWVHLGIAAVNAAPRNETLTAFFTRGEPTRYVAGLV